jgi:hypothetical protein
MKSSKASKQLRTWRSQRASDGHSPIRRSAATDHSVFSGFRPSHGQTENCRASWQELALTDRQLSALTVENIVAFFSRAFLSFSTSPSLENQRWTRLLAYS